MNAVQIHQILNKVSQVIKNIKQHNCFQHW